MPRFSLARFLCVLLTLCALTVSSHAQVPVATPTPAPLPLSGIFNNKGVLGIDSVRSAAQSQSTSTPYYKSNGLETRYYEGYFKAAADTSKLALLSDDGTSVWINGTQVLGRAGQGQGFENFDSTFSPLSYSFAKDQVYFLRLQYTNTVHTGDADVDGLSLWAYDGGGEIKDTPSISKMQYLNSDGSWVDITKTLYVFKNTAVTFRAVSSPASATWPSNKPQWGGTSGATATGETTNVTFSSLSLGVTVTATCDNTVTANVVVYDLQPKLTPVDDFANRSYEDFGVGEDIDLSCDVITSSTSSSTISASNIGGVELTIAQGDGQLTDSGANDGTGFYTVGTSEGTFTISAQVKSGPSRGKKAQKTANQVRPLPDGRPTGANLARQAYTSTWHKANSASAGFAGEIFLLPNNVSFDRIQMREGTCEATATGFLANANGITHPLGYHWSVGSNHAALGCQVMVIDCIGQYGPSGPYSAGTFTWPIPWYFQVLDKNGRVTLTDTYFATANHINTVVWSSQNNEWMTTVAKKNAGPFYIAVDAASSNTGNPDTDTTFNGFSQLTHP